MVPYRHVYEPPPRWLCVTLIVLSGLVLFAETAGMVLLPATWAHLVVEVLAAATAAVGLVVGGLETRRRLTPVYWQGDSS